MKTPFPVVQNHEIPDLEFYQQAFKKFDSLIQNIDDYPTVEKAFLEAFGTYPPISISPIKHQKPEELAIYRARTINEAEEDITDINTFSYNRNIKTVKCGRANLHESPVFYGATSEGTAIKECSDKIKEGQELYIGEWRLKKNVAYGYANLVFNNSHGFGEMVESFNEYKVEQMKQMFSRYEGDKQAALVYFITGISNYFLRENYKASSFLGHYYLYDKVATHEHFRVDILMYPSVKSQYNTFNFAIRPEFVDSSMELVEVKKVRINKFEKDGGSHVTFLNNGKLLNGKVQWYSKGILLPENIKIEKLGVELNANEEGIKDLPPLDRHTQFQFAGSYLTFEELFLDMVTNNFDVIAPACMEKIDSKDPYKTHKLEVNWNQKTGLMKVIHANRTYDVLNLKLMTIYNLVDVEVNASKLYSSNKAS